LGVFFFFGGVAPFFVFFLAGHNKHRMVKIQPGSNIWSIRTWGRNPIGLVLVVKSSQVPSVTVGILAVEMISVPALSSAPVGAEKVLVVEVIRASDLGPSVKLTADDSAWHRMHMQGLADDCNSLV
jgi:hypothetical protein